MKKGIDFTGVTVVYFCHDGKGNVVMQRRGAKARDEHGRWDIGGGGVEFGESVEVTLKKEILEEYCSEVLSFDFLGFRDVHREYEGKKTHWIALDFKVLINPKQVKNGEPHKLDEVALFSFTNMPEPKHSQLPYFLEKYQAQLFK